MRRTHTMDRVTHFTFIHNAALYPHNNDALYTLWHCLHLQITVPYSHTQRRLMHTLRRRLHTMTLLHLHTTPHYTHKTTTPYTHNDVIIHTAAPLTFTPKCRLVHAPQNAVHAHNGDLYIQWRLLHLQTTPPYPKKQRDRIQRQTVNTPRPITHTHNAASYTCYTDVLYTHNDAFYSQRRLFTFAHNAAL